MHGIQAKMTLIKAKHTSSQLGSTLRAGRLAVLSYWARLCVTVANLFTLVRITSQVQQPVYPPNET